MARSHSSRAFSYRIPALLLGLFASFAGVLVANAAWVSGPSPGLQTLVVGARPAAIAVHAGARIAAIVNEESKAVSLVNLDTGVIMAAVAVADSPREVVIDVSRSVAFVAHEGGQVSVIDLLTANRTAEWVVDGGSELQRLALNPSGSELIVAAEEPNRLLRVNATTGAVVQSTALSHEAEAVSYSSDGAHLYVATENGGIRVFNTATWSEAAPIALNDTKALAYWSEGNRLVAVDKRQVHFIDTATGTWHSVAAGSGLRRLVLNATNGTAYAIDKDSNAVAVVGLTDRVYRGRVVLPDEPSNIALDSGTGQLLVTLKKLDQLLVVDPAAAALVPSVFLGEELNSITVDNASDQALALTAKEKLYIVNLADKTNKELSLGGKPLAAGIDESRGVALIEVDKKQGVQFLDLKTHALLAGSVPFDPKPVAIGIHQGLATAIVLTDKKDQVFLIDTATRTLTKTLTVAGDFRDVAIHEAQKKAYLLSRAKDAGELLILDLVTQAVVDKIVVSKDAKAIVIDDMLDLAVLTVEEGNKVEVIDLKTKIIAQSHVLSKHPHDLALNRDTHTVVVVAKDSDQIAVLDLNTQTLTPGYAKIDKPQRVSVSQRFNQALVISSEKGEIQFVQLPNPTPVLTEIVPPDVTAPSPAVVLLAVGKHFIDGSTVHLDGQPLTSRWKDASHLEADVPAEVLKTAGLHSVQVVTGLPSGGESEALTFSVNNPAPVLTTIAPTEVQSGKGDQRITLTGNQFLPVSEVYFGAQKVPSTYVRATELSAVVPSALLTASGIAPITVFNPAPGGGTSAFVNLTVRRAGPVITAFSPASGPVGTEVTITGENFDALSPGSNQVRFNGALAVVATATATQMRVIVPLAATSGAISVSNTTGSTTSADPFTVIVTEDFSISVAPGDVKLPLGGNTAALIRLTSTGLRSYQQLIDLNVTGLPAGMEAVYSQARLSPLQPVLLTLKGIGAVAAGTYPITVEAKGLSDGRQVTRTQTLNVEVLAGGTTTLTGRIVHSDDDRPFVGAVIRLGSESAVTNEAGQYRFVNPALRGDQVILIDGHTNNTSELEYPSSIVMPVRIVDGQDNVALTSYLSGVDTSKFTTIVPGEAATVTSPEIPNFALKIPDGVTLTGWDGTYIDKINVRTVSVDRLPIRPLPEGVNTRTVYLYYFFRPGGANPSKPIPVVMNNDVGSLPGEKVDLWYYDESPEADPNSNQWRIMGQGTVSEDGKSIVSDPGVGIPKFCCGASFPSPPPPPPPPGGDNCGEKGGNPVDLASGIGSVFDDHSLGMDGLLSVRIGCRYNSMNINIGPFGRGTYLNYGWQARPSTQAITLITPAGIRYNLALDSDGVYRASSGRAGAYGIQATVENNLIIVRLQNGTKYEFPRTGVGSQQLTAIVDPNRNRITLGRDSAGRVTVLTDARGRLFHFEYSGNLITKLTDPVGRILSLAYDTSSRLVQVTDPLGQKTHYAYDANHRVIQKTDVRGAVTRYAYDDNGRTTEEVLPDGSIYRFDYTVSGGTVAETRMTDPNGNLTTYRFNGQGYETRRIDALGRIHKRTVDYARNLLLAKTDPVGRVTRYAYDQNGNRTSIKDPEGNITLFEYDLLLNKPIAITNALGYTTKLSYDAKGNLKIVTNPEGEGAGFNYNAQGKLLSIIDALGHRTTFEYDADGNLIESQDSLQRRTRNKYDAANRLIETIDAHGQATRQAYDAVDRVTAITDALGQLTAFTYDEKNNLLTVTDPKGVVIETNAYDLRDRLIKQQDALNRSTGYFYDGNGNLTKSTDRKGQNTSYAYDALNRRIKRTDMDGRTIEYVYDLAGNLTQVLDSQTGEIRYGYDALGRLISETSDQGVVTYAYDAIGRLTKRRINGGNATVYAYDKADRIKTITHGGQTVTYVYDLAGRLVSRTLPHGILQSFSYNDASELLAIVYKKTDGSIVESIAYDYDLTGNRLARTRPVINAVQETGFSATYDARNRMLTYNGHALIYDDNGNLVEKEGISGPTVYTWDARNQLVQITGPNGTASFKYDALGRRIEKSINGTTTQYIYDGPQAIAEIHSNTVGATYLTGLQIDEILSLHTDQGEHAVLTDALGSVIALAGHTQVTKAQYSYSPFGESESVGETVDQLYQYTSREHDDMGLYYYRARYYDPKLKRFIGEDPIGLEGGINVYAYVGNDPINRTDPYGLRGQGGAGPTPAPVQPGRPSGGTPGYNRDLHESLENLPDPRVEWPKTQDPGVHCDGPLGACRFQPFPPTPKPYCWTECPNQGGQCRRPPANGAPDPFNPGCYRVCGPGLTK